MSDAFTQLDPEWAWAAFEPSSAQPWNRRLVAHLFRRAGFAATSEEIELASQQSPQAVVAELVASNTAPAEFERAADSLARTILASGDPARLSAAWVYRLLHTPNQLQEKMTVFWHGHFATSAAKVTDAQMMWDQNQLFRENALGDFAPLVQSIARDPAMLIYLDSATNRKAHPNENFARELMELFCLGEGNYTEHDVQELARCFTGWEIKSGAFRKNRYQQDTGEKSLFGITGQFDGEDGVRLVLEREAMPLFICRKLVKFFVCDEPEPSDVQLRPLAVLFRESNLQIAPLVQRILGSNLFFSQHAIGRKIRSPVELLVGLLRALEGTTNAIELAQGLNYIGQGLFYPPNVKGWDGGRTWINSSTLIGRANLIDTVMRHDSTKFSQGELAEFFEKKQVAPQAIVRWLEGMLMAVPLSSEVRERVTVELTNDTDQPLGERIHRAIHTLAALPEFQLG